MWTRIQNYCVRIISAKWKVLGHWMVHAFYRSWGVRRSTADRRCCLRKFCKLREVTCPRTHSLEMSGLGFKLWSVWLQNQTWTVFALPCCLGRGRGGSILARYTKRYLGKKLPSFPKWDSNRPQWREAMCLWNDYHVYLFIYPSLFPLIFLPALFPFCSCHHLVRK